MNKLKNSLYRFMQGRYGVDQLGNAILVVCVIAIMANTFFIKNSILSSLIWVLLVYNLFRTYSRKIYARRAENEKYLSLIKPITRKLNIVKKQKDDKEHKYLSCPQCHQTIRIPVNKGKVTITCPACHHKFDGKS